MAPVALAAGAILLWGGCVAFVRNYYYLCSNKPIIAGRARPAPTTDN